MDLANLLRQMADLMAQADAGEADASGLDEVRDQIVALGGAVLPDLEALLLDPNDDVAMQAARVLERMGDDGLGKAVGYYVAHYNDRNGRGDPAAAARLLEVGPDALPFLQDYLGPEVSFDLRIAAMNAAAAAGGDLMLPVLEEVAEDEDFRVAQSAAEAIGRIGGAEAFAPLVRLLGHPHANVRYGALIGLDLLGDRAAVEPVVDLFEGDAADIVAWWDAPAAGPLRVRDKAESVIRMLTGEEFGGDVDKMRAWVDQHRSVH